MRADNPRVLRARQVSIILVNDYQESLKKFLLFIIINLMFYVTNIQKQIVTSKRRNYFLALAILNSSE